MRGDPTFPSRHGGTYAEETVMLLPWRTGRSVGRTVYAVVGDGKEASKSDVLIGLFDTPLLAQRAVEDHNRSLEGGDLDG